ncbi:MAG: MaoC/PaaZ C-terminal domain-containing protein [Bacillota bacterium]
MMIVSSGIVGAKLKDFKTMITWRRTTNYAASINDLNPCYLDDTRESGIVAPPMFAVAVTWPVLENINNYLETPWINEVFNSMVHYIEHIEFQRLITPGDRLTVKGEVAAVVPHKSGTLLTIKFEVGDCEGLPVFTEYTGALLRGIKCDGAAGAGNIPQIPHLEPVPAPVWEVEVPIEKAAPYVYDGCNNIVFAIHTSPKFASTVGLPGIIYQGTATMAQAVRELVNREAGGDPARLRVISGRFAGMVFPGSTIKVQLQNRRETDKGADLFFRVLNEQGQEAVRKGYARLAF